MRQETLHLTLAFLGDVELSKLPVLCAVGTAVQKLHAGRPAPTFEPEGHEERDAAHGERGEPETPSAAPALMRVRERGGRFLRHGHSFAAAGQNGSRRICKFINSFKKLSI